MTDGSDDKAELTVLMQTFFKQKEEAFLSNEVLDVAKLFSKGKDISLNHDTSLKLFEFERLARASVVEDVTNEQQGYEIRDISISDSNAIVDAVEWYEYTYQNDDILSSRVESFKIECVKENDNWFINNIETDNELEGFVNAVETVEDIRNAYFSGERSLEENKDNDELENEFMPNIGEVSITSGSTHEYNRDQAKDYALDYSSTSQNTNAYNSLFISYSSDCQNFVSQCVWYGLGGTNTQYKITNRHVPMIISEPRPWWGRANGSSESWRLVESFANYVSNGSSTTKGIYGSVSSSVKNTRKADVIQFHYPNSTIWQHSYIVNKVSGTLGSRTTSNIWVCSHTTNRRNENLYAILGTNSQYTRLVRINGIYY